MDPITPEYARLRRAITERLNAHDLLGGMDHGAPEDEYGPEMEDFASLTARGETITPEVVATVWHKWFGDSHGSKKERGYCVGAGGELPSGGDPRRLRVLRSRHAVYVRGRHQKRLRRGSRRQSALRARRPCCRPRSTPRTERSAPTG